MEPATLKSFECISRFVADLGDVFAARQHSLRLYQRLLGKVGVTHHEAIRKHVATFLAFTTANRAAIVARDAQKLTAPTIYFSDRVYIRMDEIFRMADDETQVEIWKHLLAIAGTLDPGCGALNVLRTMNESPSPENNLVENIMNKIGSTVNVESADPMSAVLGLFSSGAFSEIIGSVNRGMSDGSIDVGKLLDSVKSMMGNLGESGAPLTAILSNIPTEEKNE